MWRGPIGALRDPVGNRITLFFLNGLLGVLGGPRFSACSHYADTAADIEKRRKAFLRKWHLKCRAIADSLDEAGDRLFTFTRLDPSQWKSARTTNAIERLNEEFRRRIKTQTVLPCAETVPMLLWALMASGQIQMRKIDGWETLAQPIAPISLDLAA